MTESGGEGLDILVSLGLRMGALTDQLEKRDKHERWLRANTIPVDAPLRGQGSVPASGPLAIDLGTPPEGKVWLVRRMAIGGVKRSTSVAGSADLYVSAQPPVTEALNQNFSELVDYTTTLPSMAFYSHRQIVLTYPERIIAVIIGGTPGQTILASGSAEQYDLAVFREIYAL